jgi:hypothetical protein
MKNDSSEFLAIVFYKFAPTYEITSETYNRDKSSVFEQQ